MVDINRQREISRESARRYRARKRGEDVPLRLPGPKKGYKQSPEHIAKRKRFGTDHPNWKGDAVSERAGRSRAIRRYPNIGPCIACGDTPAERHHINGNTADNEPDNIAIICRRCHMKADGRMDKFIELAKRNQPRAVAARWS